MKYNINGIEKARTVKSVEVIKTAKNTPIVNVNDKEALETVERQNSVIVVDYLDGTQDIFEYNEENLDKIKNIMLDQAKQYASQLSAKKLFVFPFQIAGIISAIVFTTFAVITIDNALLATIFGLASAALLVNSARLEVKKKDLKKYNLFINKAMNKVDNYNEILKREKELAKSKKRSPKFTGIMDLDKTSTSTLEYVVTKVERYQEVEGKTPKKKSL